MRAFRRGRILDTVLDTLFPAQTDGNSITLARIATDNYIRPRTPNVDCTTTNHTPIAVGYDDGTQTNRWVSVAGKSLPVYVDGMGWLFSTNNAIRTNYNIPTSITQYTARVAIPAPFFPVDVVPRQWCLSSAEKEDVYGRTISGLGIRWGNLFWGVGHYQIRCCSSSEADSSACLILVVGSNLQYFFPLWGKVSQVDLTIKRISTKQARVIATSSAGTFQQDITQSLDYSNPYQAEYYLQQVSQGCSAPPPIAPYTLKQLQSPDIQYTYFLELDSNKLELPVYLGIKAIPDPFTAPVLDVLLEILLETDSEILYTTIPYEYNTDTNLWHAKQDTVLDGIIVGANVVVQTNQILERVSVLMGGAVLHYVPAPHQVEWMAVLPIEMEQTGIPSGIIPSGYDVLGVPDYARVLTDGTIAVLPAQHARAITIHLRERNSV